MSEKSYFPEKLLNMPIQSRIEYFENYTVAHPLLVSAYSQLYDAIQNQKRPIILVYGPTGVGKSTLFTRILKRLIEEAEPKLEEDPGLVPVVGQEAIAPDNGKFDWKDFYIRSLEALYEPLIDKKVNLDKRIGHPVIKDNQNRTLRKALENALKYRNPGAFIVDEAQHLIKMSSGRKLSDQMDIIKSLASHSKVPHVLIGTYEVLHFRNLSGQLTRRGNDVHFSRYKADNPSHIEAFAKVLYTFQYHMPFEETPVLYNHLEFFYERSIGCIGILKDWLSLAVRTNLLENKNRISMDDFVKVAYSIEQCIKMAREAAEGEAQIEEDEEKRKELHRILGLDQLTNECEESKNEATKPKQHRVGQRSAKRDKVGGID